MSTYILNTFKISYMIKNNVSLLIGMRRMTIAETARLAGVSYNTIYALYHDQTAGIEFATLNKLCEVLDCTTNDLLKLLRRQNSQVSNIIPYTICTMIKLLVLISIP